jgi:hypothetical protein
MGFLFLLLTTWLLSSEAFAEDAEWSLHLDSKINAIYYPEPYGEETNQDLEQLELIPIYRWKKTDTFRFFFKPQFTWDPNNKSTEEQTYLDGEAYFRIKGESQSLQFGYNVFNWGVTDGYNPMDVLNSRQYFDPLHSKKRGLPSLVYSLNFEKVSADLVYAPINVGSTLPGVHSRWLPREVFIPETPDNDIVLNLPPDLRYTYQNRDEWHNALHDNFAARIQFHFDAIDIGLMYYEGASSFPLVQPIVTGTIVAVSPKTVINVDPDVLLDLKDYRNRVAGISWVSSQWGFILKLASTYTNNLGNEEVLPGWIQENVLGLEKSFDFGNDVSLIGILQGSYIRSERENDSNLSVTEIFRRAVMAGGRMTIKEVWNLNFLMLLDTQRQSNFQEISLQRRLYDVWTLALTADFIAGSSETPLGVYSKNDSYALSLSRSF